MVENLAVYLKNDKVEWKAALPDSTTNGGFMKKATQVDWPTEDGAVKITLMQGVELKSHLQGLAGFVQKNTDDIDLQQEALAFVDGVHLCMGVQFAQSVDENGPTIQRLKNVAAVHGGAIFVHDSLLKDGRYIAGELAGTEPDTQAEPAPAATVPGETEPQGEPDVQPETASEHENVAVPQPTPAPTEAPEVAAAPVAAPAAAAAAVATVQLDPAEMQFANENPPLVRTDRRARTLAHLASRGFTAAETLPIGEVEKPLRPATEIAARLGAAAIAYLWCVAPRDFVSDEELQTAARSHDVAPGHTAKTGAILSTERVAAQQQFGGTIGWSLENMWALAWVLGFDHEIQIDSGMIDDAASVALRNWMPIHGRTMTSILAAANPRTADEVADREDIFYCAHNAVRSAQTGHNFTVPEGFDPVAHGGTVHERRHGLTWCLSPGIQWDATDLST